MLTIQTQPPKSQKAEARPISFVLAGYSRSDIQEYKFVIRPEELSRMDPSRVTVHQTLGGERLGWADDFGQGLPTINISGHTGWRVKHDSGDGMDRMISLKARIDSWHKIRQERINAGMNPDDTKLIFIDTLDQFAVHVVSGAAQTSLAALGQTDPVLAPMTQSELLSHVNNVVSGVSIA